MRLSQLFSHWEYIRSGTLATLDRFQLEELSYVPFDGAMSVGEIAIHIANAEDAWIRFITRRLIKDWPKSRLTKDTVRKDNLRRELTRVHDETMVYLDSLEIADLDQVIETPWGERLTLGEILWHVIEHEIHHRGELSLILGLIGREGLDV